MSKLPKIAKFIKYHWRHCAVFDPAQNNTHLYEVAQQFGHEHAFPNDDSPEEKCKGWLKRNGYSFTSTNGHTETWSLS